uniref:Retrotransposon gag domain-containing protein n=1 Tax=Knipowitschia caucasica TaxID=637954 RepID=A0AAV2J093_KNICA
MAEDECKYVPPWTQGVCNIRVDLPAAFCGDGRKLFATWIKQFEAAVRAQTRGDGRSYAASLTALLPTRLDGAAFLLWDSLPSSVQCDFERVKEKLNEAFGQKQFLLYFQTCVSARPRGASESLELYAADLSRLVAEAFPEYDKMAQNGEKFRRFLAGLDPGLRAKCHEQGATDLEEALMIAGRCERARMALGVGLQSGPGSHPAPATVASLSAAEGTALGTSGVTGKLLGAVERLTDRMDKLQMEVVNLRAQRSDHTPRTSQGFPCACECGGFGCRSSAREHRVECNGRAPRYGSRNNREWSPQAQEDRGAAPDYPHRREEDETPRRGRFSVEPEWRRGVRFLSPARRSPSRRSPSPSPIRRNQGNDQ